MDVAVKYEQFDIEVIKKFWEESSTFYIYRRLGMVNLTLKYEKKNHTF